MKHFIVHCKKHLDDFQVLLALGHVASHFERSRYSIFRKDNAQGSLVVRDRDVEAAQRLLNETESVHSWCVAQLHEEGD